MELRVLGFAIAMSATLLIILWLVLAIIALILPPYLLLQTLAALPALVLILLWLPRWMYRTLWAAPKASACRRGHWCF